MLDKRGCGVLLHPTSLPGPGGIGTLGADAVRFIDLLSSMGMSYWQVLPLTPPACGNSPYSAFSAFAGNPLLIDPEQLAMEGDLAGVPDFIPKTHDKVDFDSVYDFKMKLLRQAACAFLQQEVSRRKHDFWHFCDTTPWLHDFALFMALKQSHGATMWSKWGKKGACLTPESHQKFSIELGPEIGIQKYLQWQFFRQWRALKEHANSRGIAIIGDLPIFVAYDSADVWAHRQLFLLDGNGRPTHVAGVPPDYFSKNGQLWGNPLYDWDRMKHDGYSWWVERFRAMFELFDIVRVDHFRGFEAAWHVPSKHRTAQHGSWVKGPGADLFDTVISRLGKLPIIAEDLGVITDQVEALRDRYDFPGMKILQFAFDSGPGNPYLPHNHVKNGVVYTGTHDNDTTLGWFGSLNASQRHNVLEYLCDSGPGCLQPLICAAMMSVANTVILPLQDLLALDSRARMNVPGMAAGNWDWRFSWNMLEDDLAARTRILVERYGRIRASRS